MIFGNFPKISLEIPQGISSRNIILNSSSGIVSGAITVISPRIILRNSGNLWKFSHEVPRGLTEHFQRFLLEFFQGLLSEIFKAWFAKIISFWKSSRIFIDFFLEISQECLSIYFSWSPLWFFLWYSSGISINILVKSTRILLEIWNRFQEFSIVFFWFLPWISGEMCTGNKEFFLKFLSEYFQIFVSEIFLGFFHGSLSWIFPDLCQVTLLEIFPQFFQKIS